MAQSSQVIRHITRSNKNPCVKEKVKRRNNLALQRKRARRTEVRARAPKARRSHRDPRKMEKKMKETNKNH